jgi:MoaA/NifB/PqqE/SkfB family radical SAM enzyme
MRLFRREDWGKISYDVESDEFEAWLTPGQTRTDIRRPISAGVLITGRCNLKCEFCYGNEESLPKHEVDAAHWSTILARLRSWGLMRVDISGGEPTMKKDFPRIIDSAVALGMAVVVSTNGLVLNPDRIAEFSNVRWHVSLDSGLAEIHEKSRLLPVHKPSFGSLEKTSRFLLRCAELGVPCRVLTCVGTHNREALFLLGERLALLGVTDWNISKVLRAGRAQSDYERHWRVSDESMEEQVSDLRRCFSFMRIRYSSRTEQQGYFLLLLPDGTLATQFTDGRDKVVLGDPLQMTLFDLAHHRDFDLRSHARKWIAAELEMPGTDGLGMGSYGELVPAIRA